MTVTIDGQTMPVRGGLDEGEVTIRSEWDAWENEEYHRKVRTIGTVRTWTIHCREKNVDWNNSLAKYLKEKMRAGDALSFSVDEGTKHQASADVYVLDVEVSYVWGWETIRDFRVELQEA